jgi:hypothetical protein
MTMADQRPVRVIRLHKLPEYLGVERTAIKQMIDDNKLHPFTMTPNGRAKVVTEDEVAKLQQQRMAAEPRPTQPFPRPKQEGSPPLRKTKLK